MGGKDPPGTPRLMDRFRKLRDTHLLSPLRNILLSFPPSEQTAITSTIMRPTPLNAVMTETVTESLNEQEEVVLFVNNEVPLNPNSLTPSNDI